MVAPLRSRASLHLEILALRHQLAGLQGSGRRPQLKPADRLLWAWLSRAWSGWQDTLVSVKPSTVISWQRKRFRDHWTRLSRCGEPGRPPISQEIRALIRKMSRANPCWGSLRIRSELRKLGIDIGKSTVEKYRVLPRKPPSPTWRAFLANHAKELVSLDFFTVSTARFTSKPKRRSPGTTSGSSSAPEWVDQCHQFATWRSKASTYSCKPASRHGMIRVVVMAKWSPSCCGDRPSMAASPSMAAPRAQASFKSVSMIDDSGNSAAIRCV
jgi:hypothetical protein